MNNDRPAVSWPKLTLFDVRWRCNRAVSLPVNYENRNNPLAAVVKADNEISGAVLAVPCRFNSDRVPGLIFCKIRNS